MIIDQARLGNIPVLIKASVINKEGNEEVLELLDAPNIRWKFSISTFDYAVPFWNIPSVCDVRRRLGFVMSLFQSLRRPDFYKSVNSSNAHHPRPPSPGNHGT